MKYLTLLISSLLFMTPLVQVKAETDFSADGLGYLMGDYMCESLMTTGTMNDSDVLEEFATEVAEEYDDEDTEALLSFLTFLADIAEEFRNEDPEEFFSFMVEFLEDEENDEFNIELMSAVLEYFNDDEECLETFLD